MRLRIVGVVGALLVSVLLAVSPWVFGAEGDQARPSLHVQDAVAQEPDQQQVYALPGTLAPAQNQPFGNFLIGSDGTQYGLVGKTPEIERQIDLYRGLGPDVLVKVWGLMYYGVTYREILVDAIQLNDPTILQQLTPQPTATPQAPSAIVISQVINVRSGPSTNYPVIGSLSLGNSCPVVGRNADSSWWLVRCPNGVTGWVSGSVVQVVGDVSQLPVVASPPPPPTPTPAPAPTATPVVSGSGPWRASFYNNRDLSGSPVAVMDVGAISFNWGTGAPLNGMPADNFSVRFERTVDFPGGNTEFVADYDDGIRVWVDNDLIIDDWREGSLRESRATRSLSGSHNVRVDYFEAGGNAWVSLAMNPVGGSSSGGGTVVQPGSGVWNAVYYNNTDLAGTPSLQRNEGSGAYPYDMNWGSNSPAPGIVPSDNWSARYIGTFSFDSGDYRFYAHSDDGVRVYIDGLRVIDAWSDGYKEPNNKFVGLGGGNHQVTIEFYERSGGALNQVWWNREGSSGSNSDQPHRDE